jgi:TNF receptor-associated protein 1
VKLSDLPQPTEGSLGADEVKSLVTAWLKEALGERVAEVKASDRLVDSPALALNADKFMSPHLRRMMKAMQKDGAEAPLARQPGDQSPSRRHQAPERAAGQRAGEGRLVAEQILDNALISAGLLDDANQMVRRLYKLLETV